MKILFVSIAVALASLSSSATSTNGPFTGRIVSTVTRFGQVQTLIYTAGTNCLRIERAENDRPYPLNLIDRASGNLTLLFPHNRTYMVIDSQERADAAQRVLPVGIPTLPTPVPSNVIGPQGVGPEASRLPGGSANLPALPQIPQRPQLPVVPARISGPAAFPSMAMLPRSMPAKEHLELMGTGEKTNLLGIVCERYELKQLGETLDIWAASTNVPFAPWTENQVRHVGRTIEDQWSRLVMDKKLFPVLAVLKVNHGPERFRYEVKSITPQKPVDQPSELFLPPSNYLQVVHFSH